MSNSSSASIECFKQLYITQQEILKEIIKTTAAEGPCYLDVPDIFQSHFLRQQTSQERLPKLAEYSRYTLNRLFEQVGEEKLLCLLEDGLFPREPATGLSHFVTELAASLQAPPQLSVYISSLRSAIGCCDDYVDKNRYYIVYGNCLHPLSHFMLDIGEIALTKTGMLSKEKCEELSKLNLKLMTTMYESEMKPNLFKGTYAQGATFAKIVGLFSNCDENFKKGIVTAAGYYDFGAHIYLEILDAYIEEQNYLTSTGKSVEDAFKDTIAAYEKAIGSCPDCGLKACITSEKALLVEISNLPDELQKAVQRRRKSKYERPTTVLMKLKTKTKN